MATLNLCHPSLLQFRTVQPLNLGLSLEISVLPKLPPSLLRHNFRGSPNKNWEAMKIFWCYNQGWVSLTFTIGSPHARTLALHVCALSVHAPGLSRMRPTLKACLNNTTWSQGGWAGPPAIPATTSDSTQQWNPLSIDSQRQIKMLSLKRMFF